ncbi:MAG: helicase-related protein [Candidatus Nitrosocaldus sp.]|nr:helicase-related protein [Candidatus Nitrosocaldus sp.]
MVIGMGSNSSSNGDDAWIEHALIRPGSIERREYQVSIAGVAKQRNTLVVLPTGLGKTTIALLLIADVLDEGGRALFLAPTRVLVHQHYSFLKEHLLHDGIEVITGATPRHERVDAWSNASVICSTPQVALNDIERGFMGAGDFALLVFDEAHRAVGDYSYGRIVSLLSSSATRVVGFTATLPDERERVLEIARNLRIERIEVRDESSPDVRPYIKDTKVEFVTVELTPVMRRIRGYVERALERRLEELRRLGIIRDSRRVNLRYLISAREYTSGIKGSARPLYGAIRLSHALKVLDTQGITAFTRFCERLREKGGIGVRSLLEDGDLSAAFELARGAEVSGLEHPKLSRLLGILNTMLPSDEGKRGKVIIFTSYRDSVDAITSRLRDAGFRVGYLIGKAGEHGLGQDEQVEAVNRFRTGKYDILVATSVGEEGLDIAECNLVIFYDNVPSAIRFVQRKGRTGRRMPGRVIVLVTKDTIDEAYHWIGVRKVKQVKSIAYAVNRMISNASRGGDDGSSSNSNSSGKTVSYHHHPNGDNNDDGARPTRLDDFMT